MIIKFSGLVKEFKSKALASMDKGYSVLIIGEDVSMRELALAPADKQVKITVEFE